MPNKKIHPDKLILGSYRRKALIFRDLGVMRPCYPQLVDTLYS